MLYYSSGAGLHRLKVLAVPWIVGLAVQTLCDSIFFFFSEKLWDSYWGMVLT